MEGTRAKSNNKPCFNTIGNFCFKDIVDNQSRVTVIINRSFKLLYANLKARKDARSIYGMAMGKGSFFWSDLPFELQDQLKQPLEKAFSGNCTKEIIILTDQQQNKRWFESVFYPIELKDGRIEVLEVSLDEITELKLALIEIQTEKELFKSIIQNQAELICRYAIDGTIVFVNKAYCEFFEKMENEFIDHNWFDFLPSFIREKAVKEINSLCFERPVNSYTQMVMDSKGNQRWLAATDCAIFDSKGSVKEIQSIGKDITEQKVLEFQLEQTNKKLDAVLKAIPDRIYLTDKSGNIIYCYTSVPEQDYLLDKDVTAQNISDILPNEIAGQIKQMIIKCLEDNEIKNIEFERELGGKRQYFESRFIKVDEHLALSICRNITQRKNFEKELIEAKEKAEESDRLKMAFLNNISHEIRTPMNAIMGFSRLLFETEVTANDMSNYASIIYSGCRRLLAVINDVVDISRIMTGYKTAEQAYLNLTILMAEMQKMFHSSSVLNGIELNAMPDSLYVDLTILTDANKVKQILSSLLSNAIKFSENSEVVFGYLVKGKQIEFFVEDKGIGISKNNHGVIFEKFVKLENSKKRYEGTGLGLSISKSLVDILQGDIWVESELNKGSSFFFTIPFLPVPTVTTTGSNYLPVSHFNNKWEGKIILIAEDEDLNYQFINELLKRTGAKIVRAKNGVDAINYVRYNSPSIILMDIKMPKINGYEATRVIRESFPDLPIIALTAYHSENDMIKALGAGCNGYITKPFRYGEFLNIISVYMNVN